MWTFVICGFAEPSENPSKFRRKSPLMCLRTLTSSEEKQKHTFSAAHAAGEQTRGVDATRQMKTKRRHLRGQSSAEGQHAECLLGRAPKRGGTFGSHWETVSCHRVPCA